MEIIVSLISAGAYMVVAIALGMQIARVGVRTVGLTVLLLALVFAMAGISWVVSVFVGHEHHAVLGLNAIVAAVVGMLVVRARGIVNALVTARHDAKAWSAEYERALRDYRQLMRHRLANPLTVIDCATATLRDHQDLPDKLRLQLLDLIAEASARLATTSACPTLVSIEERELTPFPQIIGDRSDA